MNTDHTAKSGKKRQGNKIVTSHFSILCGLVATTILLSGAERAAAGNFTISSASTTAQTLGSGTGQTGTVTSTGTLTVSGGTVAVTISGNNETLTNNGVIIQSGSGRVIRDNTGVTGLVITNGTNALMQSADADVIQMNKSPASVSLTNSGTMISLNASKGGAQVVDFNAILSGSNSVTNFGTMLSQEADVVRPGVNGVIYNSGTIKVTVNTPGNGSDGIDAQNNSGAQITNDTGGLIEGARHGITGGAVDNTVNFTLSGTNNGIIKGDDGSGINIDGFNNKEVVTFVNHGTISGSGATGDGDGVDIDGVVNLTNTGIIKSLNSVGSGTSVEKSEGVTVGGGTIINSGTIEGDVASGNTTAVGRGITIAGVDKDAGGNPIPVQPIYANTTITNSGLIKGQSESGIAIQGGTSGFTVTINNQTGGVIEGDGTNSAAIQASDDNMIITNSGTIAAPNSNVAIAFGNGNNSLTVTGSSAAIIGNIVGGSGTNTLTIDPGAGHSFNYSGSIYNVTSALFNSGTTTLSGTSTYTGPTSVSGKLIVNGAIANSGVTVNKGGVLGGHGVSGNVTVNGGGALSPGNSPGIYTAPSLTINSGTSANGGGQYVADIVGSGTAAPVAGTNYDQTVLTGTGTVLSLDKTASTGAILTLNVSGTFRSSGIADASHPYNPTGTNSTLDNYFILSLENSSALIDAVNNRFAIASDGTNFVTINYDTNQFSSDNPFGIGTFTLDGQEWAISYSGDSASNSTSGGNDVVVTAIPEPATYAMMFIGFGLLAACHRFRARARQTA